MRRQFLLTFLGLIFTFSLPAIYEITDQEALDLVDSVHAIFHYRYAPAQWKQDCYQWDIDQEIEKVKNEIQLTENLTVKKFQKILIKFFNSTKDYHVRVRYYSTEEATLPFQVKGFDGHYYVSYIDEDKLSPETFAVELGDEVVSFGGKDPHELVLELQQVVTPGANQETDRALAEKKLTTRMGAWGEEIPMGPISVAFKSHETGEPFAYQFMWDYKPERVTNTEMKHHEGLNVPKLFDKEQLKLERAIPYKQIDGPRRADPNELGGRCSFLPRLGREIWSTESEKTFDAYLYTDDRQRVIGYIRIPHFMFELEQVEEFEEIMQEMQENAEVLVIDQLNNTGGNLFVAYAFASMLTNQPLVTPQEHILISQNDMMEAYTALDLLDKIKDEKDAQTLLKDVLGGYPMSYQACLFYKNYCHFIQDQWMQGKLYTDLTHLYGVDYVNPHPRTRFTKPVVILVNELDFSCGDFFPAIMKDNKRAILVGRRTAGAGGFVTYHQISNRLGVQGFSLTGSLGIRSNQQPIENLGVEPDIHNHLIPEDLANEYEHYMAKIHEVVSLLGESEAVKEDDDDMYPSY